MTDTELNNLRKQLWANGYFPVLGLNKGCFFTGWNAKGFYARELKRYKGSAADMIDSWTARKPNFRTTNVRLQDGLGAIDNDIDDKELSDALWDIIGRVAPAVADFAPARFGSGTYKMALFVQIEGEPFVRVGSNEFARPEALAAWRAALEAAEAEAAGSGAAPRHVEKPAYHHVEIFGGAPTAEGNCSRQFGAFGWHTEPGNKKGKPERAYRWLDDTSLLDMPLKSLPTLTKAQAYTITKEFEEAAAALGWEAIPNTDGGDGKGGNIYDIDRAKSRFEVVGHGTLTYAELEPLVRTDERIECSASFIKGEVSDTPNRCKAVWSPRYSCVMIKDWKTYNRHYPNDVQTDSSLRAIADMMEKIKRQHSETPAGEGDNDTGGDEPPEPQYAASQEDKLLWLIETRGFFEGEGKVVQLYSTQLACRTSMWAFQQRYRAWLDVTRNGNRTTEVFVTDIWERFPLRKNLAGVRMRPDKAFPLYMEDGQLFKNTYRRPRHAAAGGTVEPFKRFMMRFIPDEIEREWLLDNMAHKQRRPEIPGTSVWFVADTEDGTRTGEFGTGRGLLFELARRLYGPDYVVPQTFSILNGSSAQSAYTDWMHGAVLVTVDEAQTSATGYRRGERAAVYEVLKDIIDPAPKARTFTVKGGQAFQGMTYCSVWVSTNHADAAAIPANDRRVTVLRNGRAMNDAEIKEFLAWRDDPANIGALSRWLELRDLAGFNMFRPLATEGKAEMAELAISVVEHAMIDITEDKNRGLVFPRSFVRARVERALGARAAPWEAEFDGLWSRYCVKLDPTPGSTYRRLRVGGKIEKLFCFRRDRSQVRAMPDARLPIEIDLWKEGVSQKAGFTGHTGGMGHSNKDE